MTVFELEASVAVEAVPQCSAERQKYFGLVPDFEEQVAMLSALPTEPMQRSALLPIAEQQQKLGDPKASACCLLARRHPGKIDRAVPCPPAASRNSSARNQQ